MCIYLYILLLLYYLKTLCSRVISCYYSRKRGESAIRKSQIGGRNKLKWLVNFAKSLPHPPYYILLYILAEYVLFSRFFEGSYIQECSGKMYG